MAKKKILILTANPKNTSRRRLDQEVRDIEAGVKRARFRDQFEIVAKFAQRPEDIRRALLDEKPEIVHFSGQGTGLQGLVLEDNSGKMKLVSTDALVRLFKFFKTDVECVVLNACYSGPQANAIREHIDHVVGMEEEVSNAQSIRFAVGFYDALGAGRTYEEAAEMGGIAMEMAESALPKSKRNLRRALFISAGVSIVTVASRLLGLFSPLELATYDLFIRLSLDEIKTDERIIIVGVTDKELNAWGSSEISDRKVLELLKKIHKASPRVIGLDIFRDEPQGDPRQQQSVQADYDALVKYLGQASNQTISTCRLTADASRPGTQPPFKITDNNKVLLGFADIVNDDVNKSEFVRRQLLRIDDDISLCRADASLSYRMAMTFLEEQNIREERTTNGLNYIQLGQTIFEPVFPNTGGYTSIDDQGYQILINFRISAEAFADSQISVSKILESSDDEVLKKLKDKIVLVGYTSKEQNTANEDIHDTPVGKISGVELHAHMLRNILSSIQNGDRGPEQPLIKSLPFGLNIIVIIFWCGLGGNLIWVLKTTKVFILVTSTLAIIIMASYWTAFLIGGWWLPLVPSLAGFLMSAASIVAIDRYISQKEG